jgi:pyridoxamine 5'-phosphate oxidase family protein
MAAAESFTEKTVSFSEAEKAYLADQRLLRIATVADSLEVDVAPVAFRFDGERFHIGGLDNPRTLKYKNVKANGRVALVVDDLKTVDPWRPRGVKIHGRARIVVRPDGREIIEVQPERKWSWGIEPGKNGR